MPYVDFTITVKDEESVSMEYVDSRGSRRRPGKLVPDPIAYFTIRRMNEWVNFGLLMSQNLKGDGLDPEDLKAIGLNLYRILFSDPEVEMRFRDLYDDLYDDSTQGQRSADRRMRLRLVFESAAGSLGNLPWELLFIPKSRMCEKSVGKDLPEGSFFGQKDFLLLTRFSPPASGVGQTFKAGDEPLRILLAIYTGFPGLNTIRSVEIGIVRSAMETIPGVRILDDALNLSYKKLKDRISSDQPHIVHLIGHGESGKITLAYDSDDKEFDQRHPNDPQVRWLPATQLPLLFEYHQPRLVFLQACNGSASPANGLSCAQGLIQYGIPAVIAMQYSIQAEDAANFAKVFYQNIAKGVDVDEAVRVGRHELGDPDYDHPRFGTPVIYLRTEERLFQKFSPKEEVPRRAETTAAPLPQPASGTAVPVPAAMTTTPAAERASEPGSQFQRTA